MSTPTRFKQNPWIWQVTLLSIILGMLLAAALKTQQNIRHQWGISSTRVPGIPQALLDERHRSESLLKEKIDLQKKLDQYQQAAGGGSPETELLKRDLQNAKFLAGLTPAGGKGIQVTLRDSGKRPPADADPDYVGQYLIHDSDIRDFVNELLGAGAEAIAVNDQRIIAKSAIRCVGNTIKVNDVRVGPVYVITAVGPPDLMESGLKMRDGIVEQFRFIEGLDDMVEIKKMDWVTVPAYTGSTQLQYAKPVEAEGEE